MRRRKEGKWFIGNTYFKSLRLAHFAWNVSYLLKIIFMKTYQQKGNESLLIINQKTLKKVLLQNVVLLKSNVNYTTFYLQHGKEKVVAHTLKFFEDYLETRGFLRVHRSFMINPNFVKEYNHKQEFITMINGHKATISRRRKCILKDFVE